MPSEPFSESMGGGGQMILHTLLILSGLVLLTIGAESLVRGAMGLALRLGVTPLVIGQTIVAFGTSSPELAISVGAALAGKSGLVLGNAVGSNISNIALVLGIAAITKPMRVRSELIRREVPLVIATSLMLLIMLLDGVLSRSEGVILLVCAVAYTVTSYASANRSHSRVAAPEPDGMLACSKRVFWQDFLLLAAGLGALFAGSSLLVRGATRLAAGLGVSPAVIGLTVVAIGTSLPELATSVASALRGESDVAFGNVIGSNILNITAVLGVTALVRPFAAEGLRPLDLAVMVGSALLLLSLMRRGSVLNRWEGAILLCGYIVFLYSVISC
jgi:cation:H+ antiporter